MIRSIKALLPTSVKQPIRNLIKYFKYNYRRFVIERAMRKHETIKIIVGAAETYQENWYSTNEQWLDITNQKDWAKIFKGKPRLTHVVAEHVFEHLTPEEAVRSLKLIYEHLVDGGRVRIAVPDGYNPDPVYLKHVGIKGIGDDAADHKQLLNRDVLTALLADAGFAPEFVEGYDKSGELTCADYSAEDGFIMRSRAHQDQSIRDKWAFPDADTSLIMDGVKS